MGISRPRRRARRRRRIAAGHAGRGAARSERAARPISASGGTRRAPRADAAGSGARDAVAGRLKLTAGYGAAPVLQRRRPARCGRARLVALLGANGAGKSTDDARAGGLLRPVRGDDPCSTARDRCRSAHAQVVARGLALVPEGRQVFPELSVLRQPPARRLSRATADTRRDVEALLQRFPRLRERLQQRAGLLSGGEQQMLAIARGLMAQPRILLLDEPSLGLAPAMIDELFDVARRTARRRRDHAAGRPDGGAGADRRRSRLCPRIRPRSCVRRLADVLARRSGARRRPISAAPRRRNRLIDAMPLDLVLRRCRLAGTASGPCRHRHRRRPHRRDRARISPPTRRSKMSSGRLVMPGFVETHIHLDKSCILDRCQCREGTLQEAIAQVAARQARLHRGRRLCARAAHAREGDPAGHDAHAHPCRGRSAHRPQGLSAPIRRLKRDYAWAIDLEICVFPQEGLLNDPGTEELLIAACEARRRPDRRLPLYRHRSARTDRAHLRHRARASISTSTSISISISTRPGCISTRSAARPTRTATAAASRSAMSPSCRRCRPTGWPTSARRLADAGVAVTVLPATDLFLMGRGHDHNVPRGVAPRRIAARAHGVTCSLATNNVLNPFTPFGDCSLIRMANLYANIAQLGRADDLARLPRHGDDAAGEADEPHRLRHRGRQPGRSGRARLPGCRRWRSPRSRSRCSASSAVERRSRARRRRCIGPPNWRPNPRHLRASLSTPPILTIQDYAPAIAFVGVKHDAIDDPRCLIFSSVNRFFRSLHTQKLPRLFAFVADNRLISTCNNGGYDWTPSSRGRTSTIVRSRPGPAARGQRCPASLPAACPRTSS